MFKDIVVKKKKVNHLNYLEAINTKERLATHGDTGSKHYIVVCERIQKLEKEGRTNVK